MLAGALVVVAGLLVLGWSLYRAFFGGLGAYAYYVPEQAGRLEYADFAQLRQSSLDKELLPRPLWIGSAGMNIAEEDIEEWFDASPLRGTGIVVIRTRRDEPLRSVCTEIQHSRRHEGVEYAKVELDLTSSLVAGDTGSFFIAKTGPRTYLLTRDEEAMKRALERLRRRQPSHLQDQLERVLKRVSRFDNYVVTEGGSGFFGAGEKQATGFGYSVTADFTFEGVMIFRTVAEAKAAVAAFRGDLDELRQAEPAGPSDAQWRDTVELLEAVRIKRKRDEVCLSASWPTKDAERLFEIRANALDWGRLGTFVQHFLKSF
jgi:hypothetical protein